MVNFFHVGLKKDHWYVLSFNFQIIFNNRVNCKHLTRNKFGPELSKTKV